MRALLVLVLLAGCFAPGFRASRPRALPAAQRQNAHVRYLRWNPVLRGSHESMLRQNELIDRLQLPRIADDDELVSLEVQEIWFR